MAENINPEKPKKKKGNPNGNPQNLKNFRDMTPERLREVSSKGGKASVASARKRRNLQAAISAVLSAKPKMSKEAERKLREELDIPDDIEVDFALMTVIKAMQAAMRDGNYRALVSLAELAGQDAKSIIARERMEIERERVALERERLHKNDIGNNIAEINAQLVNIADLLNAPRSNRSLEDLEDED